MERSTYGVDEVEAPGVALEVLEGDGVGVDVERQGSVDEDIHEHKTLGAQLVREDLDGVADEQTGPGERVEDTEEPDEEDHGVVRTGRAPLLVQARGQSPEDEGAEHAASRSQEEWATADPVDEQGHSDGDNERQECLAAREAQLLSGVGHAGLIVERRDVVGDDGVAGPLREDAERGDDSEAVAVALGPEEVEVRAGLLVLQLQADRLLDLVELKLHRGMLGIAVGVVLGQDVQRPVVLVLGHEVAGGFRNEEDEGQLDKRWSALQQRRDAPRPLVAEVVGAERDPRDQERADVPQAVVHGREAATMLRVAELGEQHGRGQLSERVTEAEENTATHEGCREKCPVSPCFHSYRTGTERMEYLLPRFWQAPCRAAPTTMMAQPRAMGTLRPKWSAT